MTTEPTTVTTTDAPTEPIPARINTVTPGQLRRLMREYNCSFMWIRLNFEGDCVPVGDATTAFEDVEKEFGWTRQQALENLDAAEILISKLDACALLTYTDMLAAGIDQDVAWPIMADLFKNLNTLEEPKAEQGGLGAIALYDVADDGTITPVDPEEGEA